MFVLLIEVCEKRSASQWVFEEFGERGENYVNLIMFELIILTGLMLENDDSQHVRVLFFVKS